MARKEDPNNIIKERINNPAMSMADIGRKFDVSRERVRQILSENHLATYIKPVKPHCPRCGREYSRKANFPKKRKICNKCFMKLPKVTRDMIRNQN